MVTLWGRRWTRPELLARVGRLEQVAGFEILVDRGFDIGGAWIGGRPLAWCSACCRRSPAASTRQRVHDVRELAAGTGADVLVGVDGGVTIGNAAEIAGWGIDVIVSGSAIFDRVDPAGNLDLLSAQLRTPEEVSDGQR